jgi:hypothetical protein
VWLDLAEMRGGDRIDDKIRTNVKGRSVLPATALRY